MKTKTILMLMLALTALMIILHFFDFLALHDIYNDYASKSVTSRYASTANFPDWTHTPLEWGMVNFNYAAKFFILISFIIMLVIVVTRKRMVE